MLKNRSHRKLMIFLCFLLICNSLLFGVPVNNEVSASGLLDSADASFTITPNTPGNKIRIISAVGLPSGNLALSKREMNSSSVTQENFIDIYNPSGVKVKSINITSLLTPRTNDKSDNVNLLALKNGNILVQWDSGSINKGFDDAYFFIMNENAQIIKPATKLNIEEQGLDRYVKVTQLSNGDLGFVWTTGGTLPGSTTDYAIRIFDSMGNAKTNQISTPTLGNNGPTGSVYTHEIAASSSGTFMVVYDAVNFSSYHGLLFNNDGTPKTVNGDVHFPISDVYRSGSAQKKIDTLSNGNYVVSFKGEPVVDVVSRDARVAIFKPDGIKLSETILKTIGNTSIPTLVSLADGGYILADYHATNTQGAYSANRYDNDGNVLEANKQISDTGLTVPLLVAGFHKGLATIGHKNNLTEVAVRLYGFSSGTQVPTNAEEPNITTQPSDQTVNKDDSVHLTVEATTSKGNLSYQWYSNTTNSTTDGTAIDGATSATYTASTDTAGTTYYYCVVKNTDNSATGDKAATVTSSVAAVTVNAGSDNPVNPSDTTPPAVGYNGSIIPLNITTSGVKLDWTKATDDVTTQGDLEYQVYQSRNNNIDTVNNIEANGTALSNGITKDLNTFDITSLAPNTTYYFNIIVKDAAGNKSAYTMVQVKTLSETSVPSVTTDTTVLNLSSTSATVGGDVTSDGNSVITERGIVYSTNADPTTDSGARSTASGTTGVFSASISGLNPKTTYHYRAYATNSNGTSYGSNHSFTTKNNNANLSDLEISPSTLNESFAPNTTSYTAYVPSSTNSMTVTSTLEDNKATIKVNNQPVNQAVNLDSGKNAIDVVVTAEDQSTTKTYTITVYRLAPAPNVTADDERNMIDGINTLLEYQIDGGPWTQYNPLNPPDLSGTKTVKVRIPGSDITGIPPSEEKELTFTKNLSQPIVTNTTTAEDTQSSNGLDITPNSEDSAVTYFKISEITGGTLYKNDGTTPIGNESYITISEGSSGLKFRPDANANTPAGDTFSFKVQAALDVAGRGLGEAAVAMITVTEVNDNPVPQPDSLPSVMENSPEFSIPFATLLANDEAGPVNESGQTLIINSVTNKKGGTVRIEGTNVIFTPESGYRGIASFIYTVQDNGTTNGNPNPRVNNVGVSFEIEARADKPTMTSPIETDEDTTTDKIIITPTTAGGAPTTHFKITDITGGKLYKSNGVTQIMSGDFISVFEGQMGLKFTPNADEFGTTGFGFNIQAAPGTDGTKLSVPVTAKIIVKEVNDTPIAVDDQLSDKEMNSHGIEISFSELLENDKTGPDNENDQTLTIKSVDNAVGGTVAIQDEKIKLNPSGLGTVSFDYTVEDNGKTDSLNDFKSNQATVSFKVVDTAPPAAPNVSADDTTNKLVGADETIEFSIDNGGTWTAYDPNHTPTFTGNVTVLVRVKENGNKPAGESKTVTFTINPTPPSTGGSSGGSTPTPGPKPNTEQIVVDVDGENGSNLTKTPITRTTEPDGKVKDHVSMSNDIAKETVAKAKEQGVDTARIVIPDTNDKVSEVVVEVPKSALQQLNEGGLKLELVTDNAIISIPTTSISNFNDDLYFRVVPIKSEEEKKQVENRAKTEELVKEVTKDQTVQVLGRPMEIETNMQSREVSIVLPLKDSLPTDSVQRQEILDNLGVFIEHSDGTKELIPGTVVTMKDGSLGIQFNVTKFSTFTLIYMEGWEEYQEGQKDHHKPYIHGTGNGYFAPNANVTRAQMAAMLARNLDKAPTTNLTAYQDVNSKHWAYADIMEAKNAGIMLGVSSTNFDPEGSVTRSQMAAIAYRWIQAECKNDSSAYESCGKLSDSNKDNYKDVPANHWAVDAINFLKATEIMVGYDDGDFHPEDKLTRAQAVKVLNRLFKRGPLTGVSTPTFKDVPTTHWAFDEIEEAAREHQFTIDTEGKEVLKK